MLALTLPRAVVPEVESAVLETGHNCMVTVEEPDGAFSGVMQAQIDRITDDEDITLIEIIITDRLSDARGTKIAILLDR